MSLEQLNSHPRDSRIEFIEYGHKYIIDKNEHTQYTSATTFVKSFFNQFDADSIIEKMIRNGSFRKKYKNKTKEQVKKDWSDLGKEACRLGTILHELVENTYNQIQNNPSDLIQVQKEFDLFQDFHNETKSYLTPYRFEWRIFDEELQIAGSIDAVFKNKNNNLVIYDWKRSKEIKIHNDWEQGKYPIQHLSDTNFYHYALQLNLYKYILETNYNVHIEELAIVVFYPTNRNYSLIKLPFLTEEIKNMIQVFIVNKEKKHIEHLTTRQNIKNTLQNTHSLLLKDTLSNQPDSLLFQDNEPKSKSLLFQDNEPKSKSLLFQDKEPKSKSLLFQDKEPKSKSLLFRDEEPKSKSLLFQDKEPKSKSLLFRDEEPKSKSLLFRDEEPKSKSLLFRDEEPKSKSLLFQDKEPKSKSLLFQDKEPKSKSLLFQDKEPKSKSLLFQDKEPKSKSLLFQDIQK